MWTKPWSMIEGFVIGGGLIVVGLMLELCIGPVIWDAFAWPMNCFVLTIFLLSICIIFLFRKKVYIFEYLTTYKAAVPTLIYVVILTLIMGLTHQTVNGVWFNNMLSFWPFVLIYVLMSIILGIIILKRLSLIRKRKRMRRDIPFLLNHLGLFIVLTTATLGNADIHRLKMVTTKGIPEWRALTPQQDVIELPLAVELKQFIMETYDDGTPRRFASDIQILTKSGKNIYTTVEVNKPIDIDGWNIYQYGYDTTMGAKSTMSILEFVRDPWKPVVYTGIFMMLIGAICLFVFTPKRKEENI
ncbi:MAG: cytochrome c biogenesis protein ResB [Prevotella sp.]|nr:cytochrome c biogenesis protein ResB [Prevotella sp.]